MKIYAKTVIFFSIIVQSSCNIWEEHSAFTENNTDKLNYFELALASDALNFNDSKNQFSFEEIQNLPLDLFEKNKSKNYIMAGLKEGSFWTRFDGLENIPEGRLYLEMNQSSVEIYEVFIKDKSSEKYIKMRGGMLAGRSSRLYLSRMPTVIVPKEADLSHPFYIRAENQNDITYRPTLYNETAFQEHTHRESYFFGAVLGVLVSMFIYNLFVFISLKEKVYLYYVLYILASILFIFPAWGVSYVWFPNSAYLQISGQWITVGFVSFFALLFSINFLQLKIYSKKLQIALFLFVIPAIAMIVLGFAGYYRYASLVSKINGILVTPLVIFSGFYSYRKGNRSAVYFITGWSILMISYLLLTLKTMGVVPESMFNPKTVPLAIALESMFLSLALADKIKQLNRKKIEAQVIISELKEKEAERLEKTVEIRTKELAEANAAKDRFFSILAHDLRTPIANITLLLDLACSEGKALTDEKISLMHANSSRVYNLLDNLLTWAKSQKGLVDFKPVSFSASEKMKEILKLVDKQATAKNISLNFKPDGPYAVYADPDMTGGILRNLITNALKFTERGGTVDLSIVSEEKNVKFIIRDSGVGMDEEKIKKLFLIGEKHVASFGTENEKGSGLGLVIAKEFTEMNGGKIGCSSVPEHGSEFWFLLPASDAVRMTEAEDEKAR